MTNLKVKDWFINKVEVPVGYAIWDSEIKRIMKETEKASLCILDVTSKNGKYEESIQVWIPKSCIENAQDYEEKKEKAFEEGKARYEKLIAFCKENGIKKARVGLRTTTIMRMIEEAGLVYNA